MAAPLRRISFARLRDPHEKYSSYFPADTAPPDSQRARFIRAPFLHTMTDLHKTIRRRSREQFAHYPSALSFHLNPET